MRWARLLVALALLTSIAAGCDGRWWLGPLHATEKGRAAAADIADIASWTLIEATRISIDESLGATSVYISVNLPVTTDPARPRTLALHFQHPLNGAKVDASGWRPAQKQTLMHGRRFPGAIVQIPLGTSDPQFVYVTIHRHLRQPPILVGARVGNG